MRGEPVGHGLTLANRTDKIPPDHSLMQQLARTVGVRRPESTEAEAEAEAVKSTSVHRRPNGTAMVEAPRFRQRYPDTKLSGLINEYVRAA